MMTFSLQSFRHIEMSAGSFGLVEDDDDNDNASIWSGWCRDGEEKSLSRVYIHTLFHIMYDSVCQLWNNVCNAGMLTFDLNWNAKLAVVIRQCCGSIGAAAAVVAAAAETGVAIGKQTIQEMSFRYMWVGVTSVENFPLSVFFCCTFARLQSTGYRGLPPPYIKFLFFTPPSTCVVPNGDRLEEPKRCHADNYVPLHMCYPLI